MFAPKEVGTPPPDTFTLASAPAFHVEPMRVSAVTLPADAADSTDAPDFADAALPAHAADVADVADAADAVVMALVADVAVVADALAPGAAVVAAPSASQRSKSSHHACKTDPKVRFS
mmetsp:Transcript_30100/g.82703  ORF Transcript_30100/g.82703 Transcript_30100/m.82703 type:complete len:118 (-) Transcript_30100:3-356(-)